MTDKEKQIEEMANIIQNACNKCNECELYNTDMFKDVKGVDCVNLKQALNIYNAGCRIIYEDSVVLSKEELEIIKSERFNDGKITAKGYFEHYVLSQELEKERKETAKAILKMFKDYLKYSWTKSVDFVYHEIEKHFSVEVEE